LNVGIRVWGIKADETEEEITAGATVANVTGPSATTTLSATWSCPTTVQNVAFFIIVYRDAEPMKTADYATDGLPLVFMTEDLNKALLAATWTVYYAFYYSTITLETYFRFGSSTYNSRIENFTYGIPPAKFAETVYVSSIQIRSVNYKRRRIGDLSVITDLFSFVYTPIVKVLKRYFVENLAAISAYIKTARSYYRIKIAQVPVSDCYVKKTAYSRKFVDKAYISDIFKRLINYKRKIVNTAYISEVFRKSVGFPRRFVEDLSALTAAFKRRVSYLRKIVNLTFITDIFSYVYTPIVKFYKRYFVENLSVLSAVLKRRAQYTRRAVNFTFISEVFRKSAGFPRKFVENLSALSALLKTRIAYFRRFVNLAYISEVFSHIYKPVVKVFKRYFVEDLSVLSAILAKKASYLRRITLDLSVIASKIVVPIEVKLKLLELKAKEMQRKIEEILKRLMRAEFKLTRG
jgi:RNAse (barnase) inhibitor barstar